MTTQTSTTPPSLEMLAVYHDDPLVVVLYEKLTYKNDVNEQFSCH